MNYLEQLLSEWYQYKGYFVRQNVRVGKRKAGGYAGELDIVALNTKTNHLIHLEPSSDTHSWAKREERYEKKFKTGKEYISSLFDGIDNLPEIEQVAIFLFGSKTKKTIGGGKVVLVSEMMQQIYEDLKHKSFQKEIVPENFPLIRTIQIFISSIKNSSL
ncbi:MAG: hypothetical protein ABI402_05930 [Ferruginibacter sp.]